MRSTAVLMVLRLIVPSRQMRPGCSASTDIWCSNSAPGRSATLRNFSHQKVLQLQQPVTTSRVSPARLRPGKADYQALGTVPNAGKKAKKPLGMSQKTD